MSVDNLPIAALPAWSAYQQMLQSKTAHFEFLVELDRKYERGGRRSLAEMARLDNLLAAHTAAVRAFRAAVSTLTAQDEAARNALLAHINESNAALGSTDSGTVH